MKKYLLLLALPLALCFAACGDDDDKDGPKGSDHLVVVIDGNGKASNGAVFEAIDDQNFYLDYIKYTILGGHLVVSGYDEENFEGEAKIVAEIKYKGTTYKVEEIGNDDYYAFECCEKLTSVTIPNTVKSIGGYVFSGCKGLTSITIPESVTSIDFAAFRATGLKSVTIPKSVTIIEVDAFCGCQALTSMKVAEGNPQYDSRENCNAIIETATNTMIAACKTTVIPNTVTAIGRGAFQNFKWLKSFTIPESVTSIGMFAFQDCTELTSITIPNSVTSIGEKAFGYCESLTTITIPANVTSIGYEAFRKCANLNTLHFKGKTPPTSPGQDYLTSIFYDTGSYDGYPTAYVPKGTYDAYMKAFNYKVSVHEE